MSGLDAAIEAVFAPIAGVLSAIVFFELPIFGGIPVVVIWLAASAVFFTVWLRFQPITGAKHSLAVIRGRFAAKTDPGEVSSFQALATELSGTVGLGNIAGVAIGITVGGPGAALWIALFGIFAMSVKMAEAVLGNKYRTVLEDGSTVGGPMYMLREGFAEIGWKKLGIAMGAVYAVLALIGMLGGGNMFQANQVTMIISDAFGEESFLAQNNWVVGVVLAAMVAVVVLGGVTSIARWTSRITPYMAIAYILCVLVIVAVNLPQIPAALGAIIVGAFNPQGVAGGAVGVAVVGIQRALFSNAAGVGTAAMSFSATKTRHAASDGYTAMWGPLIDSVVVCMLTAVAIVVTGVHTVEDAEDGVVLTASAFATVADWFPVLLMIIVFLFGFSTLLSYSFFCEMLATYLFGPTRAVRMTLRVVYVLLVVVGASISMTSMVAFADATTFLVTIPNLIGLYVLAKVVRLEVLRYRYRVETGVIEEIEDEDLRVGMGDHEPTEEQVRTERERTLTEEMRLEELHRRLEADPEWPHSYNKD